VEGTKWTLGLCDVKDIPHPAFGSGLFRTLNDQKSLSSQGTREWFILDSGKKTRQRPRRQYTDAERRLIYRKRTQNQKGGITDYIYSGQLRGRTPFHKVGWSGGTKVREDMEGKGDCKPGDKVERAC